MSTSVGVDTATAAARRRQRRLRSWLKHERQTVARELAAPLHHSRDGGRVTNYGPRAPKTASSGVLTEPESQGRAVTVGYVAARVLTLAAHRLQGDALTAPLSATSSGLFWRRRSKRRRGGRKWRRRRRRRRRRAPQLPRRPRGRGKKRRKKKTPKTSSSRAVRTQESGHSSTSFSWYVYSGGVMSSVACGSSILLGMYWLLQHSANSVLDCAYSWSSGVKVATFIWTRWKTRVVLPSMLAVFGWLRCTSCCVSFDCRAC